MYGVSGLAILCEQGKRYEAVAVPVLTSSSLVGGHRWRLCRWCSCGVCVCVCVCVCVRACVCAWHRLSCCAHALHESACVKRTTLWICRSLHCNPSQHRKLLGPGVCLAAAGPKEGPVSALRLRSHSSPAAACVQVGSRGLVDRAW